MQPPQEEPRDPGRPGEESGQPPLRPDYALAARVERETGVAVGACYGCRKCANGCPLTFAMDLTPYQVVRCLQLGQDERLEGCRTIWVCASCHTCVTRCPNQVDLPRLMDHLKQTVAGRGRPPAEERTALFHRLFLDEVLARGRVFEGGLMGRYLLKTGGAFGTEARANARLAWAMLRRGRLKLLPSRVRRRGWLKALRAAGKEA
jgi:heterodisulfide reductase subunit C